MFLLGSVILGEIDISKKAIRLLMNRLLKSFLLSTLVIALPSLCLAEKIYLEDGTVILGKIIEETKTDIVVETKVGVLKIKKELVLKVAYTGSASSRIPFGQSGGQSGGVMFGFKYPSRSGFRDLYGISFAFGGLYSFFVDQKHQFPGRRLL